jgi:superfamily II DNA or RNA helicase
MKITLTHWFKDVLPDVDEFFLVKNGPGIINSIGSFTKKIDKLSAKYAVSIDPNKFKGDMLELFVEYLIKTHEADNRVGIFDYVPIESAEDYGVDGTGKGDNGFPAAVQVKYRTGDWILSANADHLSNFVSNSQNKQGVRLEDTKNMLIITTGKEVAQSTIENMLFNKVRVLNREALRIMLDNRPEWWKRFYEAVKESRTPLSTTPVKPLELRTHQVEAENAIFACLDKKGKVVLPTGTGKTLVEAEAIKRTIEEVQKTGKIPIIKINSPRILLCFQLFEDIFKRLNSLGISASYINYNSGKADAKFFATEIRKNGGVYQEIVSTTMPEEVKKAYDKCVLSGLPLIVFSTYHSSEKFALSELVPHLTIHDEAHNLVSRDFCNITLLPCHKDLFFTATEKVTESDLGEGMNNVERFGTMIYTKSPREMIEAGEMVPPYIHVVTAKNKAQLNLNNLDTDYDAILESIGSAFFAHQEMLDKNSFDKSKLGAKVLVVCRGQEDLIEMFNTNLFDQFRAKYPKVHIFALSSDFGIYNDDMGKFDPPVTSGKKYALLKKVQALKPSDQAIIFHVDMIGEGIDVPGITGVMPFRNCEMTKFIQNVGRAARLHPEDRRRFYNGEITVADYSKWIKRCAWIIIPTFLENADGFEDRFRGYVIKLRDEYGFVPQQQIIVDNVAGLQDEEPIDVVNDRIKNRVHRDAGQIEFDHEFEKLSIVEKIMLEVDIQEKDKFLVDSLEKLLKTI